LPTTRMKPVITGYPHLKHATGESRMNTGFFALHELE
jgi:hypothetical protein